MQKKEKKMKNRLEYPRTFDAILKMQHIHDWTMRNKIK